MATLKRILISLVLLGLQPLLALQLPGGITKCSAKDPNVNQCFLKAANEIMPLLAPGIREIGALPLDPLFVPLMRAPLGNELIPSIGFNITNATITGLKDAKISRVRIEPDKYKFRFTIEVPDYTVLGLYDVTGNIVSIPLEGSGGLKATLYNLTWDTRLDCDLVTKNKKSYIKIMNFTQVSYVENAHVNLGNLFGDEKLSEATNIILNTNIKAILDVAEPMISYIIGDGINRKLIQNIFDKVPYNQMFDDVEAV